MRKAYLAGNWKMNGSPLEGAELARALRVALTDLPAVDVAVFPPFLSIPSVTAELKATDISVGGQDLRPGAGAAYT